VRGPALHYAQRMPKRPLLHPPSSRLLKDASILVCSSGGIHSDPVGTTPSSFFSVLRCRRFFARMFLHHSSEHE
jgi:hypothetical protein